jgi:enamine deaminase RidA (YjgF/YER057c/UK114 family)
MLKQANMALTDVVKVTQHLTRAEDILAYASAMTSVLESVEPGSMLLVIPQLVRPEFLIEIKVIATKV